MATGDMITVRGSYATIQAATSTANGAFCSGSRTAIGTALAATVEDYPLLDLKLAVSSGTPTENGKVDVYRIPSDGTDAEPTPAGSFAPHYVGSFVMDNTASTEYYIYGVSNVDQNDTFIMYNNDGTSTLTIALSARGRSVNQAA